MQRGWTTTHRKRSGSALALKSLLDFADFGIVRDEQPLDALARGRVVALAARPRVHAGLGHVQQRGGAALALLHARRGLA